MIARGRNKLTIRTTGDRILMQQEAEEQARVTLAKECQSITTVEHGMTLEEYNEAIEKFRTACEREKDKFYITPAEYGAILRYHRKNAGLSPMELSERTRIPAVVIEGYENGRFRRKCVWSSLTRLTTTSTDVGITRRSFRMSALPDEKTRG